MLEVGSLAFASPWILLFLGSLPIIWWILKITPPLPRRQPFPPLRIMLALREQEQTPAQTPFWLLILRILTGALIIGGFSGPLWNPGDKLFGTGPLIIVVDNGWASAPVWRKLVRTGTGLIDQAEREGRATIILPTAPRAPDGKTEASGLLRAEDARKNLRAMEPAPWASDRNLAKNAIEQIKIKGSAHVVYLTDGLETTHTATLLEKLQEFGSLQLFADSGSSPAYLVKQPVREIGGFTATILRPKKIGDVALRVRLDDDEGRLLGRASATFKDGNLSAKVAFSIPSDVLNRAARLSIEGGNGAGTVFLMDESWKRRPLGIITRRGAANSQSLLNSDYFVSKAMEPFGETIKGTFDSIIERPLALMVLDDAIKLNNSERQKILAWIEKGGVFLRFAGPEMTQGDDPLIPVRLRLSRREMGGAMSWSKPARLSSFAENSPFAGLQIPPDVKIKKQILAEPTLDLDDRTWARLSDGTPLVTAKQQGYGWIVLVHVTANTEWSNLPLSGLFIQMLERMSGLGKGVKTTEKNIVYPPIQIMDGFGILQTPPGGLLSIRGNQITSAKASFSSPPGYYGTPGARFALNLSPSIPQLRSLETIPSGMSVRDFDTTGGTEIKAWVLLAATMLIILDLFISLIFRGALLKGNKGKGSLVAAFCLFAIFNCMGDPAIAQKALSPVGPETIMTPPRNSGDSRALQATLSTHLAFVVTGNNRIDSISRAGLEGLSLVLRQRTSIEPGAPLAINLERDDLEFISVLYWPISEGQPTPSERAVGRLNNYLRTGGTILFDTREQGNVDTNILGNGGIGTVKLRELIGELDIPPLVPVPSDHVLTKAFYLLDHFPGRWTGGKVWVERRGGRHNDGVSSIIIGSHDWASAWARDSNGLPIFPVVPNGERQREYAFRFGVNWIMYALTGNYKTDQVHVPSIIERLGQ
jgi:hypothetical protein